MQQISEDFRRKREIRFGTKNGFARLVRNRWPTNTVCHVMAEWGLTDGEARGVVYAQASQRTIDKIKQHPKGGWRVIMEVEAAVIGESVFDFFERERTRIADEQARAAKDLARLDTLGRDLATILDLGSRRSSGVDDAPGRKRSSSRR